MEHASYRKETLDNDTVDDWWVNLRYDNPDSFRVHTDATDLFEIWGNQHELFVSYRNSGEQYINVTLKQRQRTESQAVLGSVAMVRSMLTEVDLDSLNLMGAFVHAHSSQLSSEILNHTLHRADVTEIAKATDLALRTAVPDVAPEND